MKTLIILTIIALYSLQATAVEIKTTNTPIGIRIAKAKECIKVRAAEMKPDIRTGPDNCKYWIDMVNSIERNRILMLDKLMEMCNKAENLPPGQVVPSETQEHLNKFRASCDKFSAQDCPANLENLEAILARIPHPFLQATPHVPVEVDPFDKHYKRWKKCVNEIE